MTREVDGLDCELKTLRDSSGQLGQHVQLRREEGASLADRRQQLERQLQDVKQHFRETCDDRRAANLETLSLRHDRDHVQEELFFLQRTADEEEQTLEGVCKSNEFLERSNYDLSADMELLERQWRGLSQQVASERELNRVQERETAELRSGLERMRREQGAALARLREARARVQRLRDLKAEPPRPAAPAGAPAPRAANTWAAALTRPPGGADADAPAAPAPPGAARRGPGRAAGP